MTITNTSTMIFIGNLAPIDNDETDWDTDNANSLIGTYNAFEDLEIVDITNHDVNEDGAIYDDEAGSADYVEYAREGASFSGKPDATITYFATVTEEDGTVHNIQVLVVQMTNGDVFVGDKQNAGALDNLTIRSIELTAPETTSAAGYNSNQNTSNTTVCFAAGTYIRCCAGMRRIETLCIGDLVHTLDDGAQPIRLITSQLLTPAGQNAPICITAGALGLGQPTTRLRVSPQHRILVDSVIAQRMFGTGQILVPAKRLLGLPGVHQENHKTTVRYWYIMLDTHHIIQADGAWAETLLPGAQARLAINNADCQGDVAQMFAPDAKIAPARLLPPGHAQKRLLARHLKNRKPLLPDQPSTRV